MSMSAGDLLRRLTNADDGCPGTWVEFRIAGVLWVDRASPPLLSDVVSSSKSPDEELHEL